MTMPFTSYGWSYPPEFDSMAVDLIISFSRGKHGDHSTIAECFFAHEAKARSLRAPSAPDLEHNTSQAQDQLQIRDRRVTGVINGLKVDAIPDTGADASFISAAFLTKLKRLPTPPTIRVDHHHTALPPVASSSPRAKP